MADLTAPKPAPAYILTRLSVLMFLQFWIWGAWYLSVSLYMHNHGMGAGMWYAYTAGPLAAILSPFFMGMFADRLFNTEKVLAWLFLLAGGFMLALPAVGAMAGVPSLFEYKDGAFVAVVEQVTILGRTFSKHTLFNALILAHMLCYMPTLALTASLSFRHLPKGSTQFPIVRLWGTLGWIVAGLAIAFAVPPLFEAFFGGAVEASKHAVQFVIGGGASVLLGLYCFTLPATPAPKKGQPIRARELFFVDAWSQLRKSSFFVFIACSFLVCIPLQAYYANLQQQMDAMSMREVTFWKNIGTWIEAAMLFLMPLCFIKLGFKRMIAIGIFAWVARYVLFAVGAGYGTIPADAGFWVGGDGGFQIPYTHMGFLFVILGVALHGFCYDFFFVTGQVYVDQRTPPEIRGQAQGMNIFFTQGVGMMIGSMAGGWLSGWAFTQRGADGAAVLAPRMEAAIENGRPVLDAAGQIVMQPSTVNGEPVMEPVRILATAAESLIYWPKFWWPLCATAAVILLIFLASFRDDRKT